MIEQWAGGRKENIWSDPVLLVESLPIIAHKRNENVFGRNTGPLHCSDKGGGTGLPLLDTLLDAPFDSLLDSLLDSLFDSLFDALFETSLQASFKTLLLPSFD